MAGKAAQTSSEMPALRRIQVDGLSPCRRLASTRAEKAAKKRIVARRARRFFDNVEAAFQADKKLPREICVARDLQQGFGAIAGAGHRIGSGEWGFADAGGDFARDDFKARRQRRNARRQTRRQFRPEGGERVAHGVKLRAARAADGDLDQRRGVVQSFQSGACLSRP